ncbi:MAG: hypothetical protein MRERV_17c001, partial [Mycoplasmataceae bacterium RV_VA103A]
FVIIKYFFSLIGIVINDICLISAKTGKIVDELLEKIISDIPPPQ